VTVDESRIRELEARVEDLAGQSEPDPLAEAERLADVEHELLALLSTLAETEFADDLGHPVLAESSRWRDLATEVGTGEAAAAADALVARLIEQGADAMRVTHAARVAEGSPDACFTALAEARRFDLEALGRRPSTPPLADARPQLREAFLRALSDHPPENAQRAAWATELLDRADVVLTSIDDMEPSPARRCLALVADDLEWHARNVEPRISRRRGRLNRKVRRIRAEQQERQLQQRLEARFGTRHVARFERMILGLIVLVLAILFYEAVADPSMETKFWLTVVDTGACAIFLWEFFFKLAVVEGRWRWFVRHFFVDFLPSIPFGLILWSNRVDAVRAGRAIRFLRLPRLARYVRVARPLIRVVRAFGFLTRGIDRIVRKYGGLLNRNIVLYPTREERARAERARDGLGNRVRLLQSRLGENWERLLLQAPADARDAVVRRRVRCLEGAPAEAAHARPEQPTGVGAPPREMPADDLFEMLARLTPTELETEMGQDFVSRLARAVRIFARPPIRWFPVVRRYTPRIGRGMADAEVVVAAAHQVATELKRHHSRWFWLADLHGTVTPAQFVDRIGSAMVKGAFRPAYRLLLFGGFYLLAQGLLGLGHTPWLAQLASFLSAFVGTFLKVVGSLCFGILGIGWWLRHIAGQATDFFAQSARAQYLALTESFKSRHIERDADILDRHVFAPERLIGADADRDAFVREVEEWLVRAPTGGRARTGFDAVERSVLIYRDGLDGALFVDSDTRTTTQLLGHPALRNQRLLSRRFTRRDQRQLMRLDLERQKTLLKGPYLWFSLLSQAVAHGVARLIVDYNRYCLPKDQIDLACRAERERFDSWLAAERVADVSSEKVLYVTTHFTALHFLDDDEHRDSEVAARFGDDVLARLRRDRRTLFRRVFGTYPLHQRPHAERVVNLYRLYQSWLAGGRALLAPARVLLASVFFAWRFLGWLRRCIREIRHPSFEVDEKAVAGADFRTAVRKVQRMRGPVAEAAIRLRAQFDPEYLGVRLPGTERSGLEGADAHSDLEFLGPSIEFRDEIERERKRAARDGVRLGRLIEGGLWERIGARLGVAPESFTRETLRAAGAAYTADLRAIRRLLSGQEILTEVFERAARRDALPRFVFPRPRLYFRFRRWWNAHGSDDAEAKRAAWRATLHNVDGAAGALKAWRTHGERARDEGELRLAELLRHDERITDQLVTLRAIQTLSLIDILTYREHIYRLGDYEKSGDRPGKFLSLY